ncbi:MULTISPECIES: SDR family oxidoreductase [Rhodococcus]|uniref:SDR family oxidoreductase n=1 Tax=Rhodococcus oxybenzonivorans TaxID=1990687 RepID=A0AAE5A7D0_9NOCA|nr:MULTISPECIES: SDR family oxidoreductase [Rhodococcus]MDV7241867.1 SDR family oxidoreductase [Rhodococcus oxybenzonivorans]MDV7265479.1 SDR family oxidoreductase [Rhodococcus oxybenzonivorans]MDV7273599.1 SDR family oxidoreductase [Rhodococcus oxybenzonivorans]MDV7334149.1 SDR family oxidoreductase [Rhodococcus oxybenzonivorans]MDV7343568.1 SDR family oxidoreductase [Rhodococcus oxybenzonivorans]
MGLHDDRVVIVTGAGQGIGREHALEFARQGAKVVVNDLGSTDDTVAEIRAMGGEAIASKDDVSDWDAAGRLVASAIDTFGDLHVLVNNAGILRDKMFVNMDVDMWDSVMRVHLRGTFCPTRHAVDYWRSKHKAGNPVSHPRIVNTSSPSGLYGNVGQSNYGAAKAAIASFTVILADELARLGVTVNAIAPSALTQMTAGLDAYVAKLEEIKEKTGFDYGSPANIAPPVVWLASPEASEITGRVFNVKGGRIGVAETWVAGPSEEKYAKWDPAELGEVIPRLVAEARPNSDGSGQPRQGA